MRWCNVANTDPPPHLGITRDFRDWLRREIAAGAITEDSASVVAVQPAEEIAAIAAKGSAVEALPRGFISGLHVAVDVAAKTLTVSPGVCRNSANTADIEMTAALTKSTTAAFFGGMGNGCLSDPTPLATFTTTSDNPTEMTPYHVYVADNGSSVDVFLTHSQDGPFISSFSGWESATHRRVGIVLLKNDGTPVGMVRHGDQYNLVQPDTDGTAFDGTLSSGSVTKRSDPLPAGVDVVFEFIATGGSPLTQITVTGSDVFTAAATARAAGGFEYSRSPTGPRYGHTFPLMLPLSDGSQLTGSYHVQFSVSTSVDATVVLFGWRDTRDVDGIRP